MLIRRGCCGAYLINPMVMSSPGLRPNSISFFKVENSPSLDFQPVVLSLHMDPE